MVAEEDGDEWWEFKTKQNKTFSVFFIWENRNFIYNVSENLKFLTIISNYNLWCWILWWTKRASDFFFFCWFSYMFYSMNIDVDQISKEAPIVQVAWLVF